jgi:lipopolysaccharide export system permease protein
MKILDKYILKKYLTTFVFVVIILISVICVIDYTEKNEDFITKNVPLKEIFLVYYINLIPYFINLLSPLIVFIATVFVTAKLAARTEIIAILNTGTSFLRLLYPYLVGSCIIAVITFYMYGWVIPRASKIRHGFENRYVRGHYYFDKRNVHMKIAPKTYVFMESYNNTINTGYQITLETIDSNKLKDKISASRMIWITESGKWRLEFYTKHTFDGFKENQTKGDHIDTTLNLNPKDFETQHMLYEQLTINELDAHVNLLRERGAENVEPYLIEKYKRIAYPFAIIILTIIGVIVSSPKTREGVGLQIAMGFALSFVYIILLLISTSFAESADIPASLAVWIPNIIFSIIGFIMYLRVPK